MPHPSHLTEWGYDRDTAIQTDTVLLAAPGPGFRLVVYKGYISVNQDTLVTFKDGTGTEIHSQYAGQGAGSVLPFDGAPHFACSENQSLTYSTSSAGGVTVSVKALRAEVT